jgi:hypothetical protein
VTAMGSGGGGGGGGPVIVTVALIDFVVSVTEVAVIVTVLPLGTTEGAVYVVRLLERVVAGLNDPQAAAPQVAVHITPATFGSFVATAPRLVVVLTCKELGGMAKKDTAIGVERIVRLALLLWDGLLVTVAVIVTVAPAGATEGAVNRVVEPSAV